MGLRVFREDKLFLLTLAAFGLFFARRTFRAGIWADNDSVAHYAYVRYLVDEFWPATGTFLGWCPKFNLGLPYLLFNVPPLLYVVTGATAKVLHVDPLLALKLWIVAAYLSIPQLGYWLARTFEDERTDLPKYTALALGLFSSELFGLEFYFKNGMLNPAFAVPLMMATLIAYRHTQRRTFPAALVPAVVGAGLFALTVLTHVLTTYMLCLAMGAFSFSQGLRRWGGSCLRLVFLVGLGFALSAFWLLPSLTFAAKVEAAYTWIREPWSTLQMFLEGSLLSSYPVGFFADFVTHSYVGLVAVLCGVVGVVDAVWRKRAPILACTLLFALGFAIVLGPSRWSPASILPMYEKLLWYRFITLTFLAWLLVAGYGAYRFASRSFPYYPLNLLLLGVGAIWAFVVMTQRAVKIKTAERYAGFVHDVDDIAKWLREHGDRRGRVFSEFLGQNMVEAVSVNYPRHILPVTTGFDEIGGWIYENNPAGQVLQRKGPFWYSPFPVLEDYRLYNVKYVVAGSPNFILALTSDPRFHAVVETSSLVLFETVAYEPRLAEAPGHLAAVTQAAYRAGGGYQYKVHVGPGAAKDDVDPSRLGLQPGELLLKTNHSPSWRATAGGRELPLRMTDDGLLAVSLPPGFGAGDALDVDVTWDITELRRRPNVASLGALAVAGVLLALGLRGRRAGKDWFAAVDDAWLTKPAFLFGALGLAAAAWHSRKLDLTAIGFGVRGGLLPAFRPEHLRVGGFDDEVSTLPTHLLPEAWGRRQLTPRGEPTRALQAETRAAAIVHLSPLGPNRIRLQGEGAPALTVTLRNPGGVEACRLEGTQGAWLTVPDTCVAGDGGADRTPGVPRELAIASHDPLTLTWIDVESGIRYLEAESLQNALDDGGFEAFYQAGAVEYSPSNGMVMTASPGYDKPVAVVGHPNLTAGRYKVWVLTRTVHPRFRNTRAFVEVKVNGSAIGELDPVARAPVPYWDKNVTFEWVPVGPFTARGEGRDDLRLTFEWLEGKLAGLSDVDALAFVPAP